MIQKRTHQNGVTLVEVLVVAGIMSILMMAMITMQTHQSKSNNYLEFQLKRTQLQQVIVSQVLSDAQNCACLFAGASPFPANPTGAGATLTGVSPTQVGRYNFVTPGVCSTATMPVPLVDATGVDGVKASTIELRNIKNISGSYSGEFLVNLQSTKEVAGPQDLPIRIPVNLTVTPLGGSTVQFQDCSMSAAAAPPPTHTVQTFGWGDVPGGPHYHYVGCHAFCALSNTHDCGGCGYAVDPMGGTCPTAGHQQWRVTQYRGGMTVACFD